MSSGCRSTVATMRPGDQRNQSHRLVSSSLYTHLSSECLITQRSAPSYPDQKLCAMQSTYLNLCPKLWKDSTAKENNYTKWAAADLNWTNHWLLLWMLWFSRVVRYVACWPIKHIYLNIVSRNGGSFTSGPSHAPAWNLPLGCRRVCVSIKRGWGLIVWVQTDMGWQRPGSSPHSLEAVALVARKCTSIFYRSLGRIPGWCFYVGLIHF